MKSAEEKIDNYKDIRRNLWNAFIVLTGGMATILIDLNHPIKIILLIVGAVFEYGLMSNISKCNKIIDNLILELDN